MLRTQEQIQLFLNKTKQQKLKEKQRQKLKYKKAQEATKKLLKNKSIKEAKLAAPEPKETPYFKFSITVYNSPLIERFPDEDNLYSLYELQHIEELHPEEEGRINWIVWNKLIDKYRKML